MTTYTGAELATRVLKDLGLLDSSETPSAVDLAWAEETCNSEIELLASKKIPLWNGGPESIPLAYLTVLSRRICLAVAPSFGLTDVANATLAMRAAEQDLLVLAQIGPTGEVQQAEYF